MLTHIQVGVCVCAGWLPIFLHYEDILVSTHDCECRLNFKVRVRTRRIMVSNSVATLTLQCPYGSD